MAQKQDIDTLYRGEDEALNFTMTPTTDITGWTMSLRVKQTLTDATSLLTVNATITTAAAGTFSVPITAAQMLTLPAGTYVYDVWRTDSGSAAPLAIGAFPVAGTVKNP